MATKKAAKSPQRGRASPREPGLRHERFVQEVLLATAVELGEVGYASLRIEEVARRAGVNKTSIYRRWPRKIDLVQEMIAALKLEMATVPADSGSLRTDLRLFLERVVRLLATPQMRGMLRLLFSDPAEVDVRELLTRKRNESTTAWDELVERARQRGELARDVTGKMIAETVMPTLVVRSFVLREPISDAFLDGLCAIVVDGVRTRTR